MDHMDNMDIMDDWDGGGDEKVGARAAVAKNGRDSPPGAAGSIVSIGSMVSMPSPH